MGGEVVQKESGRMDGGISVFVERDVSQDETSVYTVWRVFAWVYHGSKRQYQAESGQG
jgi:hypothetical protein